jgi:ribonuclease HI
MPATLDKIIVFTDGGSRGNPGPSASGMVLMNEHHDVIESFGRFLGVATNNQAEWTAVKLAVEAAAKYSPKVITFYMDSELVCRQLNGRYRVKNPELLAIYRQVMQLVSGYEVSFHHVYREKNKLADAEVNKAIDAALARS